MAKPTEDEVQRAIRNEVDRLTFEKGLRDRVGNMTKLRQNYEGEMEKWLKDFQTFLHQQRAINQIDRTVLDKGQTIFTAMKTSHEHFDRNTRNLTNLQKSLQKKETEPLKEALERANAPVKTSDQLLTQLEQQEKKLKEKLTELQRKISSLPSKSDKGKKLAAEQSRVEDELTRIDTKIVNEEDTYEDACDAYDIQEKRLLEKSAEKEKARLMKINEVLEHFLPTLEITIPTRKASTSTEPLQRTTSHRRQKSLRRSHSLHHSRSCPEEPSGKTVEH